MSSTHAQERVLFQFDKPEAGTAWMTVNDGVMGGRSDGRFRINENKRLEFYGNLSLENNGGFASVRARGNHLKLGSKEVVVARVRGVGAWRCETPGRGRGLAWDYIPAQCAGDRMCGGARPCRCDRPRAVGLECPSGGSIRPFLGARLLGHLGLWPDCCRLNVMNLSFT